MTADAVEQIQVWSSVAAAVVAAASTIVALFAISSARRQQKRSTSASLFVGAMTLAAQNADKITSLGEKEWSEKRFHGTTLDWVLYLWLVSLEAGYTSGYDRMDWERRMRSFIHQHAGFLKSEYWKKYVSRDFDPNFVRKIDAFVELECSE